MAPNKLDDFFRKTVENSSTHYSEKAPKTKEEVWTELMDRPAKKQFDLKWLFSAAAVILLLILSSFQYLSIKEKNNQISLMNKKIIQLEEENNTAQIALQNIHHESKTNIRVDTVVIEKIIPQKETITLVKHITDTIYKIPETNNHEFNQLARIEKVEETNNRQPETKMEEPALVVEFILPESKTQDKSKKDLEMVLMDFAKRKVPLQTAKNRSSLQASIKQFLSVN